MYSGNLCVEWGGREGAGGNAYVLKVRYPDLDPKPIEVSEKASGNCTGFWIRPTERENYRVHPYLLLPLSCLHLPSHVLLNHLIKK